MYINNLEVKIVPSFPVYAVSACGKLFRLPKGNQIATKIVFQHGYPSVYVRISYKGKAQNKKLHRLVCEAWLGQPPTPRHFQVNHKDGDSLNNHVDNLEWCTRSQNQRHAVDTGLKGKGELLYNAQLTDEKVHEICAALSDGALVKDLSDKYGVSKDIIRKIRAGDTYFHVRQLYNISHKYLYEFSEATIKWVCGKIKEGYSDKEIVEISTNPNLTIIEIKRIRYKIRYKYISDLYF